MPSIEERNEQIKNFLAELYNKAIDEECVVDESQYKEQLDELFTTSAWGFREILLVVIVGMKLDQNFTSSNALYDCNPRAIFGGPIKEFLIQKNIPHRKDGPLNIAKATVGLDLTWAAQRRPRAVAEQVVNLVEYLEDTSTDKTLKIENMGISLLRRLIAETKRIGELSVAIQETSDPVFLYDLCNELTTKAPDSGNTPQKIAAFLLKNYHKCIFSGVVVTGEEDRASVTSTTSKKPGDVNEESNDGTIYKVYEVTVKPFDIARIRDSYDCVSKYNEINETEIHEIVVICRTEDCPSEMELSNLHQYMGRYIYQDMVYYYCNIFEWYASMLQRMTDEGRCGFYFDLNNYINETNTSETVKRLWQQLHN